MLRCLICPHGNLSSNHDLSKCFANRDAAAILQASGIVLEFRHLRTSVECLAQALFTLSSLVSIFPFNECVHQLGAARSTHIFREQRHLFTRRKHSAFTIGLIQPNHRVFICDPLRI